MATAPMNRSGYPLQFDKEIAKMFYGKYADYPKEFDKIAKIETFPKGRTLTEAEITPLGGLRAMGEGEGISYDVPVEGHKKSIQTIKFGLGFQVTEEMGDDELFGMSKKMSESLGRAANVCADTNFFNLFNNGFTTTTGWDGQPVFGTHTTLKSGQTITNFGSSDLTQTALEAAFEYYDNLVDEAGVKLMLKPNLLLIPNKLKWVANDLLKQTGRVWDYSTGGAWDAAAAARGIINDGTHYVGASANPNQMNTVNPKNGIVDNWSIFVSRYLTDDDSWFLLSDQQDFRFYWKKKPTMSSSDDFDTDNKMYKVVMRFALGTFDWRGGYGGLGQ